jgi:glutathione S-transferase
MRALSGTDLPADAPVPVRPVFLQTDLPVGPEHLYQQARKRAPAEREPVRDPEPDPAEEAYEAALEQFQERAHVTGEKLAAYAEAALGERDWVRGAELAPASLDAFFAFERLSEITVIFDGRFAEHYEVTFTGERASNAWLDFPDFILRRRTPHARAQAGDGGDPARARPAMTAKDPGDGAQRGSQHP